MAQKEEISKKYEDYKKKYEDYKEALNKRQDANLLEIVTDLRNILDIMDSDLTDEKHKSAFLNVHLPEFIKILMTKKYSEYLVAYRPINALLCHWMHKRLGKLELKSRGDAYILAKILSPNKAYYNVSSLISPTPMNADFESDSQQSGIVPKNKDIFSSLTIEAKSQPFAYNMNLFGQLGGFEIIQKIISASEPKTSEFKWIRKLLKTTANVSEHLNKEQWTKCCLPISEAASAYINKMGENELKTVNSKDVKALIHQLQRLYKNPFEQPKPGTLKPVEEIEFNLALKLTNFSSLERKLAGVEILLGKLNRLTDKWPGKEPNPEAVSFADWIRTNKFVEIMFGENLREGVLKRAGPLVTFMYVWGVVSSCDIENIWDSAVSKHEVLQGPIFQMFETLALHFAKKDANTLLAKIRQLPLVNYKSSLIGVLYGLAKNEYFRNKKKEKKESKKNIEEIKKVPEETKEKIEREEEEKHPRSQGLDRGLDLKRCKPESIDGKGNENDTKRAKDDSSIGNNDKRSTAVGSGDNSHVTFSERVERFESEPFILEDESESSKAESYDVLNFIWSLTNEGAVREGLPLTVQVQFSELLLSLLKRLYRSKCLDYLRLCEGMLASDKSFSQNSKIYTSIVEQLSEDSQWKLQPAVEDFIQKIVINLVKFKRIATQRSIELLSTERAEEEECMDTQSSIEEKNAREIENIQPGNEIMIEEPKSKEPIMTLEKPLPKEQKLVELVEVEVRKEEKEIKLERKVERNAQEEADAERHAEEKKDILSTLVTNDNLKLTYYEELKQRLDLIKFLLIKGKLPLKQESITLIWQILLINSFSKKEVDIFFEFMHAVIRSENGLTLIASQVLDRFFFEILLKIDQRDYPKHAFSCLKEMIIAMNICYKHIIVKPQSSYEIIDMKLIGLEAVWEIVLQARDSTVHKAATTFLYDLFKRISPDLIQKQGLLIREDFLTKCMASIKSGIDGLDNEPRSADYTARVGRAIELLIGYINEFETTTWTKTQQAIPELEYDIIIKSDTGVNSNLRVKSTMTLRELLEKIKDFYHLKESLDRLIFLLKGGVLHPSDNTLYEEKIVEGLTIIVTASGFADDGSKEMYPPQSAGSNAISEEEIQVAMVSLRDFCPEMDDDVLKAALRKANGNVEQAANLLLDDYAKKGLMEEVKRVQNAKLVQTVNSKVGKLSEMISSNDRYFSLIYHLLSGHAPELTDKAWRLIASIPINSKMQSDLLSIKTMEIVVPWDQFYSFESPFKLSYNLKMIRGVMLSEPEPTTEDAWITCFVMLDGLNELCNLAATFPIKEIIERYSKEEVSVSYMQTSIQCLELAIRIIKDLVEGSLLGMGSEIYQEYIKIKVPKNVAGAGAGGNTRDAEKSNSDNAQRVASNKISTGMSTGDGETGGSPSYPTTTSPEDNKEVGDVPVAGGAGVSTNKKPLEENKNTRPEEKKVEPRILIRGEVGNMVFDVLGHKNILHQILKKLCSVSVDSLEKETKDVINEGLTTISFMLLSNLRDAPKLYEDPAYKEYLFTVLLKSAIETQKALLIKEISTMFTLYTKFGKKEWGILPVDVIHMDMLIEMIPPHTENFQNSETYFNFLAGFFELYSKPEYVPLIRAKLADVTNMLIDSIKKKLQIESTETTDDKQLAGYFKLLSTLINTHEEAFNETRKKLDFDIVDVLTKEIFGVEGKIKQARKCSLKNTMRSAVQFLLAICKKSPEYCKQLLPKLVKFHETQLKCTLKDVGAEASVKLPGNYVGLKNFGCTCYINSLLQQLFMMYSFRYSILKVDTKPLVDQKFDNVTANLQTVFAALLFSNMQYYPPNKLIKEFKEANGQPINVCVQQDVDEFFNRLIEKLDAELKALGQQTILSNIMEIGLLQRITSLETGIDFISSKEETCLSLPLDIKECRSIQDALDLFTREEILDGDNKYRYEVNNQLIRASKKCVIKKLAPTIILNLKRFEFDYHTMQKRKLNDYCEFPEKLNLYKWTDDAMQKVNTELQQEYAYDLVGVVVHSGTAEGGHYYSYIKEREQQSPNFGKWFEFNDTTVKPFNFGDLKRETFGDSRKGGSGYSSGTSAYLLVYQKATVIEVDSKGTQEKYGAMIEQENEAITNTRIYLDDDYAKFVKDYFKLWQPETVKSFVPLDSDTYEIKKLREETKAIISKEKPAEIVDDDDTIITPSSDSLTACKLAVLYTHDLVGKQRDSRPFIEWTNTLIPHLKTNAMFSLWLIKYMTKHKNILFDMLIECNASDVRELFLTALTEAVTTVAKVEEHYMRQDEKFLLPSNDPNTKKEEIRVRSASARFMSVLITDGLNHCRTNSRKYDEYFTLLTKFALLGINETASLVRDSAIYKVIDFISDTTAPLNPTNAGTSRPKISNTNREADFRKPLILLSVLIRSCMTHRSKLIGTCSKYALYPIETSLELPESEVEFLFSYKWNYLTLIPQSKEDIVAILTHLTWENEARIKEVIPGIAKHLFDNTMDKSYSLILAVLKEMVLVKDSYQKQRCFHCLYARAGFRSTVFDYMESAKEFGDKALIEFLEFIAELLEIGRTIEFFIEEKARLQWVPSWLTTFILKKRAGADAATANEFSRKSEFILRQFAEKLDLKAEQTQIPKEEPSAPLKTSLEVKKEEGDKPTETSLDQKANIPNGNAKSENDPMANGSK